MTQCAVAEAATKGATIRAMASSRLGKASKALPNRGMMGMMVKKHRKNQSYDML